MFLERVPIHPMFGRTAGQFLAEYGIAESRLKAVFDLPDNRSVSARLGGRPIEPSTDLMQLAAAGAAIVLPIGNLQVMAKGYEPVFDPAGLRPQHVQGGTMVNGELVGGVVLNQEFLKLCTHGLKVRLERKSTDGWNTLPCKRIRWVQTVVKLNNPHPGLSSFVDRHGINPGQAVPWYNGMLDQDELFITDKPCGPEAPAAGKGLQFTATTSVVVWTVRRVTLIAAFTWGMTIGLGKSKAAVKPIAFRGASGSEIKMHLDILKAGRSQHGEPTGSNLNYKAAPAANTINDGDLAGTSP